MGSPDRRTRCGSCVSRARVWSPPRPPQEAAHQRALLPRVTLACGRHRRRARGGGKGAGGGPLRR
eukprot:9483556-Pyramimonas_sp.AAC.1